uniref:RNA-binding protein 42 n=1 Tax=Oryzias latipes TaxID=8090 RepID=A0A3P9JVH3_ORYLA
MAAKSGDERLKEMEAEMALFEQEVLGGPVPLSGSPHVMEQVPVALAVSAVPMVRPIIGTNTYRQVCVISLSLRRFRRMMMMTAHTPLGFPSLIVYVTPFPTGPPSRPPPPILRPAFVPHILQRPGRTTSHCHTPSHTLIYVSLPNTGAILQPPGARWGVCPKDILTHGQVPDMGSMAPSPRSMAPLSMKPSPSVIQAAPTVYSAPPVTLGHKKVDAPGLLDRKDSDDSNTVIGPSMPEPEPPHPEPVESVTEDKKKGKSEKVKKCIRTAAGTTWEDQSLLEWESDDFRIFCGDLGNEVNDDILARAFSRYPSFLKAKVVRDKRTGKTKGYGFVSFKDPNDYVRAMREMNGKYVGSRPIKLRKSMWRDRNIDVVRKKQKEKKKLGLR